MMMGNFAKGLLISCLAMNILAITAQSYYESWHTTTKESFEILPNACYTFQFKSNRRSSYKLSVTPNIPPGCNQQTGLRWTPKFLFHGQCLERDPDSFDKCIFPADQGIRSGSDVCDSWFRLNSTALSATSQRLSPVSIKGSLCFGDEDYYVAFKSTCNKKIKVTVSVETKKMGDNEAHICDELENFFTGTVAVAVTVVVLLFIVLPIVLVITGITLCCCLCPGCPGYESRRARFQTMQAGHAFQLQNMHATGQPAAVGSAPATGYAYGTPAPGPMAAYGQPPPASSTQPEPFIPEKL